MKFRELPLRGAFIVESEPISDERGFFARTFCGAEFARRGMNPNVAQCNVSFNRAKGTLRGMHYQTAPHEEAKLVRCVAGAAYHVIVDLRDDTDSFMQWTTVELAADSRRMLYVPEGVAHGFLTLSDNSEILYQMSQAYHPDSAAGIRWDDPVFGIEWPGEVVAISDRDRQFPDFTPRT